MTKEQKQERVSYLNTVQWFNLNMCGVNIFKLLGLNVYLVGSCLYRKDFRDVDLRCIYKDEVLDNSIIGSTDATRRMFGMLIGDWLSSRTGLPIDFQFQKSSEAKEYDDRKRICLGGSI